MSRLKGGFTLPGEAGYEKLTLRMAEKWGADVIRDSDGTVLSDEILQAGFGLYSTICIIRGHNEFAKAHPETLQQSFLMAGPVTAVPAGAEAAGGDVAGQVSVDAEGCTVAISLMEKYYREQFRVNETAASLEYWQVFDRTTGEEVPGEKWVYDPQTETVTVTDAVPFHRYTVNFLAYRIWEEISMYNYVTNSWSGEHLMPIDPRYPEVQEYLLDWMEDWCVKNPATTVVRFTSLFYNFVWIWGESPRRRNIFTDWGSYDFTVSDRALQDFERENGYRMTSEDFINGGQLQVTHMPATERKRAWMDFINRFVVDYSRKLIDIVHAHGKKAYVFYDDSWVGLEPYNERFREFGFDGLIKCVFNAYEARLCGGVDVETHEIRLHPYLFPTGLGGLPTFMEGGDPTRDAKLYWARVRRGLLRVPIQRIGLGGYLHLTEGYPDFQDYIEKVSDEFRRINSYHDEGKPYVIKTRAAVLHYWGALRSWTLSGHFHETYMHDLIHVNEALAGLPVDVDFISFEDVKKGALENYDVIINCGRAGDAWSGGDVWKDSEIVTALTEWVYKGGTFIGIGEPSAAPGADCYFRMAHVLGVDKDMGARVCHGRWSYEEDTAAAAKLLPQGASIPAGDHVFLTDPDTIVAAGQDGLPAVTLHSFGNGRGIYLGGFSLTPENTRFLLNLLLYAGGCEPGEALYVTDNVNTECTWYPESRLLVVINNSDVPQTCHVATEAGVFAFELEDSDIEEMKV